MCLFNGVPWGWLHLFLTDPDARFHKNRILRLLLELKKAERSLGVQDVWSLRFLDFLTLLHWIEQICPHQNPIGAIFEFDNQQNDSVFGRRTQIYYCSHAFLEQFRHVSPSKIAHYLIAFISHLSHFTRRWQVILDFCTLSWETTRYSMCDKFLLKRAPTLCQCRFLFVCTDANSILGIRETDRRARGRNRAREAAH